MGELDLLRSKYWIGPLTTYLPPAVNAVVCDEMGETNGENLCVSQKRLLNGD